MAAIRDLAGQRFGRAIAEKQVGRTPSGRISWECLCDCGDHFTAAGNDLTRGNTKSCGCINKARIPKLHMFRTLLHGHSRPGQVTPEYRAWRSMKKRTLNPSCQEYPYYGGRGIKVCERWLHSFENFLADMGLRPGDTFSLDRLDPNSDYEPTNCRWATKQEQTLNRRKYYVFRINYAAQFNPYEGLGLA